MKTQLTILAILLQPAALALAAPLEIGTRIGTDLGPAATPTPNWNNFSANGSITAGNVVHLGGTAVDGVSITLAGGEFFNPGTDNWAGLASQSGSAPVEFVNTVTNGFAGASSPVPNTVTITLSGLDPALGYEIHGVTFTVYAGTANRIDTLTVIGDRNYGSSGIQRGPSATPNESADGNFHHFPSVNPNSEGTITVVLSDPAAGNPILCGLLIEATDPAPPPPPAGVPDQVWQIDFQGGPGGAYGSANPITAAHDSGDGATWNAFQIAATNDKALVMPWPNPAHNAVIDPQLIGLLDGGKKGSGRDSCNLSLGFLQLSVRSDFIFHLAAEAADTRLVTHVELACDPFMTEARRFGNYHRQQGLPPVILPHRIQILPLKPEVIEPCSYDPGTDRPIPVAGRGIIRADDFGDATADFLLNPELRQQPFLELLGAKIPAAPQG